MTCTPYLFGVISKALLIVFGGWRVHGEGRRRRRSWPVWRRTHQDQRDSSKVHSQHACLLLLFMLVFTQWVEGDSQLGDVAAFRTEGWGWPDIGMESLGGRVEFNKVELAVKLMNMISLPSHLWLGQPSSLFSLLLAHPTPLSTHWAPTWRTWPTPLPWPPPRYRALD